MKPCNREIEQMLREVVLRTLVRNDRHLVHAQHTSPEIERAFDVA